MQPDTYIHISLPQQQLTLVCEGKTVLTMPVSTAINGAGEFEGSECTPRGWHQICAKIGDDLPVNTVFVARKATGEIYTPELGEQFQDRDWILTRILWLSGLEPGKNRLGNVDSMSRYIYLHGTPDNSTLGMPGSHGCIRLSNEDIIRLYDQVAVGTKVLIEE